MNIGDVVTLTSDGIKMTVAEVEFSEEEGMMVTVVWHDSRQVPQFFRVHEHALILIATRDRIVGVK